MGANHCVDEVEEEGEEAQNETSVVPSGFSPQRAFHFLEEALLETPIVGLGEFLKINIMTRLTCFSM